MILISGDQLSSIFNNDEKKSVHVQHCSLNSITHLVLMGGYVGNLKSSINCWHIEAVVSGDETPGFLGGRSKGKFCPF